MKRSEDIEERIKRLEEAINNLYKEQIKDRVKLIGSLEYIVEKLGVSSLRWRDISDIHKEIEASFDEALAKVKEEIKEEEKVRKLIDAVFKKKNK